MLKVIFVAFAIVGTVVSARAQVLVPDDLARRAIERRAVEAVNWGMAAVNYDLMLQEALKNTAGKLNQVVYWGRPLDWHNQTLTPNPDAIYLMAFFNTKDVGLPLGPRIRSIQSNASSRRRRRGAAIRRRTPSISTSRRPKTMASPSTS
ncbi:hypothetical protein [Bradyrhizobium sp. JYMT SZCCT0428]|uniref:hypothetical protein n=1 Tax=Bradyrhizobium sp. JYMT SZCCT0428 TaxID=2807673 RepID=UPI003908B031